MSSSAFPFGASGASSSFGASASSKVPNLSGSVESAESFAKKQNFYIDWISKNISTSRTSNKSSFKEIEIKDFDLDNSFLQIIGFIGQNSAGQKIVFLGIMFNKTDKKYYCYCDFKNQYSEISPSSKGGNNYESKFDSNVTIIFSNNNNIYLQDNSGSRYILRLNNTNTGYNFFETS